VTKKATGMLPGKGTLFIFIGNLTFGKMKSAGKHSGACKPNQQMNGKEGKGKKRNDSGSLLS